MSRNCGPGSLLECETRLHDLSRDPGQERPLDEPNLEAWMIATMARLMQATHATDEAFARLGIARP